MLNTLLLLAVSVFAANTVTPAPQGRQFAAGGRQLVLVPQTGQLFRLSDDGLSATRLRASYVYEDSKAAAFHLDNRHVLKLFTGPGYQDGQWKMEQAKINEMGKREAAILGGWAKNGLALPVTEQGQTPDGVFYSVVEKPKRSVSGTYLVKTGRGAELGEKMQKLAQALSGQHWVLGTFNPTQVVVERGGQARALLVKSYTYDRVEARKGEQELRGYYDAQAQEFTTLADIYGAIRAQGPPLSDGARVTETAAIRRLIAEAHRQKREIRIVHKKSDKDKATMFHARVLPFTFNGRDNYFLKGYVHLEVFPENGKPNVYGFRIDKILEAEFLSQEKPAYSDYDYAAARYKVSLEKGRVGYPAARAGAIAFLKNAGAPEADIAKFKAEVKTLKKNELPAKEKKGYTDEEVLSMARIVISWKQGQTASLTEYAAAYSDKTYELAETGATLRQLSLFFKTVEAAEARPTSNGGGT